MMRLYLLLNDETVSFTKMLLLKTFAVKIKVQHCATTNKWNRVAYDASKDGKWRNYQKALF